MGALSHCHLPCPHLTTSTEHTMKLPFNDWQAKRLRVLNVLQAPGGMDLSNCEVGRRVHVSESLVRSVKKKWLEEAKAKSAQGKVFVPCDAPRSGRPSKFSPRCYNFPCFVIPCLSIRYKRSILSLARKHPFWSASKLVAYVHERKIAALQFARPGTRWTVCDCFFFLHLHVSFC